MRAEEVQLQRHVESQRRWQRQRPAVFRCVGHVNMFVLHDVARRLIRITFMSGCKIANLTSAQIRAPPTRMHTTAAVDVRAIWNNSATKKKLLESRTALASTAHARLPGEKFCTQTLFLCVYACPHCSQIWQRNASNGWSRSCAKRS